ncbi:hypothetical protein E2542_SST30224 [Spatholobus suberectus]|nr:hypothetical protein E2542_SST30224 [Spatholobus suberectus]
MHFRHRIRRQFSLAPARSFRFVSRFAFQQFRQPRVQLCGGWFVAAAAKKQWGGGAELAGTDDGFGDEENDDEFGNEYGEEEEDIDDGGDDEGMLPLEKMNKWFEKKPKGFVEGKVYDTSVEDKLLEEMRQSRIAQAANLKRLKSNPVKRASNQIDQNKKVRLKWNSPNITACWKQCRACSNWRSGALGEPTKEKNIHRDLKSALQGILGIINIVPIVTGNKKTRDPICKGFAFVDFKREEDAVRFVELYTGQTITLGKIRKQITCELLNALSSSSSLTLSENLSAAPQHMASAFEEYSNEDSNTDDDSALSSWDETNSDNLDDLDNQMDGEKQEADGDIKSLSLL